MNTHNVSSLAKNIKKQLAKPKENLLFNLNNYSCLNVLGSKAGEFLQGQLTCDVRDINSKQMRKGALCNLKGRLITLMDVITTQQDIFQLILPSTLLNLTKSTLEKAALFSKVTLTEKHDNHIFGFYLDNEQDLIPNQGALPSETYELAVTDDYSCYNLGNGFYILQISSTNVASVCAPFLQHEKIRSNTEWHLHRLLNGQMEISANTSGLFLPLRLDLHNLNYISLNKGCYRGQEIIARMYYRSKAKHAMKLFIINFSNELSAGMPIMSADGNNEIGEIIDLVCLNNNVYLILISIILDHALLCKIGADDVFLTHHVSIT